MRSKELPFWSSLCVQTVPRALHTAFQIMHNPNLEILVTSRFRFRAPGIEFASELEIPGNVIPKPKSLNLSTSNPEECLSGLVWDVYKFQNNSDLGCPCRCWAVAPSLLEVLTAFKLHSGAFRTQSCLRFEGSKFSTSLSRSTEKLFCFIMSISHSLFVDL